MASNTYDGGDRQHLGGVLTSYCFGDVSAQDQEAIEAHLMGCDVCWTQFQRLDAAVRTLRPDSGVGPAASETDVISILGLAGRLHRPFAGHVRFAIGAAALFAAIWTLGLWSELGYAYGRFGGLAWALSVPVAAYVAGSLSVALWLDAKATRTGLTTGLLQAAMALLVFTGLLMAVMMFVLPAERTILASIETRTASAGYFKDVVFLFLPLALFVLPSFHAVVVLQRELHTGHTHDVLTILNRDPQRILPRGMLFLSTRFFMLALVAYGTVRIVGTNYMLDALTPGPYAQLFTIVAYVSTGLALVLASAAVVWYAASLNELKREAVTVIALKRRESSRKQH